MRATLHTLTLDNVSKRYGETVAVDRLSFTVEPGRVTGFLGPNGAGKSTTMKMLLDLAAADEGRALIGDRRYRDLDDPLRTVGVILEADAFHPARSARNHLRVIADTAGIGLDRVDEVLAMVGLDAATAARKVGEYSLGMRQRLGLAAALLGDPPVLVLDEPGNGLDPQGLRWLRDLLRWRADQGGTVFVSSHLLPEMEQLADEVVVIKNGRLVTRGAVAELRQQSGCLVRTPTPDLLQAALVGAGLTATRRPDGATVVSGATSADVGDIAHAADVVLHELSPLGGSLEDLFFTMTSDEVPA